MNHRLVFDGREGGWIQGVLNCANKIVRTARDEDKIERGFAESCPADLGSPGPEGEDDFGTRSEDCGFGIKLK